MAEENGTNVPQERQARSTTVADHNVLQQKQPQVEQWRPQTVQNSADPLRAVAALDPLHDGVNRDQAHEALSQHSSEEHEQRLGLPTTPCRKRLLEDEERGPGPASRTRSATKRLRGATSMAITVDEDFRTPAKV